jgi:hypothetical protein
LTDWAPPMRHLLFLSLTALACTSAGKTDPQIWHPSLGDVGRIPGPMKNLGPFVSFSDALKATCPLILSKPNATVVHLQDKDPELALRVSTEYCAWLYYTPAHKYELSMLSDQKEPGDALQGTTSCLIPPDVDDPRYPPDSIQYIFLLHNHPFASELSERDVYLAAAMSHAHSLVVEAGDRKIPFAVIAFFTHSKDAQNPTCDGFYQYIPATSEMLKWLKTGDSWQRGRAGRVQWISPTKFILTND